MSFIKEFEHLKISLKDIKLATKDFASCIGQGGFGKVYKGELLLSKKLMIVAVKRLDTSRGQGTPEFWKEIMFLSRYKHDNLVALLGFCDEGGENILVYEYVCNTSLDLYLSNANLSWNQRLRICIGAAHGLQYLHDPADGTQQRVLHRDIKSANILLDQNWNAKISDFGLSKFGPANQQFSFLFSNAVGTVGYCDPLYVQTGYLTKESDVYSFGVVLLEVLCGRQCVQNYEDNRRFLTVLARKCYEEKRLDTIICDSLKEQISPKCLEWFSKVAYQCLRIDRTERPSVTEIVTSLETAMQYQVAYEFEEKKKLKHNVVIDSDSIDYWETKLPQDWEVLIRMFNIPSTIYSVKKKLFSYLQIGLISDQGDQFFWISDYGEKCVMQSAIRFLDCDTWVFQRNLRFSKVAEYSNGNFSKTNCHIKTSMLSLGIMYGASLVFKYRSKPNEDLEPLKLMMIKWKMDELSICFIHYAELTSENWYKINMWHFLNHGPVAEFDIVLEELSYFEDTERSDLLIQGIEFQPIEMHEKNEGDVEDKDDNEYWEKQFPNDYQHYLEISDKPLDYTTKKELYFLICAGFLADNGQLWFSMCKLTRGICSILPGTDILCNDTGYNRLETLSLSVSRFKEVKKLGNDGWYIFICRLRSFMFSPHCTYACYLVFKFKDDQILCNDAHFYKVEYKLDDIIQGIVFARMNSTLPIDIPRIKSKNDHGSHDSSNLPRFNQLGIPKGHMARVVNSWMEERNDGWMEVRLSKPLHQLENHQSLEVKLWKSEGGSFSEVIVEGIEFRPLQDVSNV